MRINQIFSINFPLNHESFLNKYFPNFNKTNVSTYDREDIIADLQIMSEDERYKLFKMRDFPFEDFILDLKLSVKEINALFLTDFYKMNLMVKNSNIDISEYVNFLNNLKKEERLSIIRMNFCFLQFINNPTDEEIKASLEKDEFSFSFIKGNEKFVDFALDNGTTGDILRDVSNQTVDMCLKCLTRTRRSFHYVRIVPNPNYETTLKNLKEKKAILEALK